MSTRITKGTLIAERTLVCLENPRQKIVVKLAKPKYSAKCKYFECSYQITGKGVNLTRSIGGMDGFQALQLALGMIGAEILSIEKRSGIRLRFNENDAGFPYPWDVSKSDSSTLSATDTPPV